ncbi:hypothetical protein MMC17_003917 [Xylographa soralifera]|nr:hypothetical protein [Xylographa soralifera]
MDYCLIRNISTLELDLEDYSSVEYIWQNENPTLGYWQTLQKGFGDNFIATVILGLKPGEPFIMFPFLRELRLSEVHFDFAAMEMACALNMTNLRSLKLHKCPGYLELLDSITKALQPIRLTSFELLDYEDNDDISIIANFLEAFTGLQELYLSHSYDVGLMGDFWPSISHHKSSLKRLVYHKLFHAAHLRSVILEHNNQNSSMHGSANEAVIDLPLVDCIGISDSGSSLELRLEKIAAELKWKLLHIRWNRADDLKWCSSPNFNRTSEYLARHTVAGSSLLSWRPMLPYVPDTLHTFATWAFGPNGLSKLEILAFGDFSHKGRYDEWNVLLCRRLPGTDTDLESNDEPDLNTDSEDKQAKSPRRPYRIMRKEDWGLWDGIEGGFAMLEACPLEPLFTEY